MKKRIAKKIVSDLDTWKARRYSAMKATTAVAIVTALDPYVGKRKWPRWPHHHKWLPTMCYRAHSCWIAKNSDRQARKTDRILLSDCAVRRSLGVARNADVLRWMRDDVFLKYEAALKSILAKRPTNRRWRWRSRSLCPYGE